MAKKYLTDPVTGERIKNLIDGNEPTGGNVISDPLSGEKMEINLNPVNSLSTVDSRSLTAEEAETLPSFSFDLDLGQLRDLRAENQSAWDQWGNGLAKAGVTFGGALLDNTIGAYFGLGSLLTGGSFFNNEFGQMIDSWNQYAQENLPNYYTRAEQESINLFSANFWADKVLNGAAYSAASMVSIMIPGLGLTKVPAQTARMVRNLSKASTLGDPMDAIRAGKELGKIQRSVDYLTTTTKSAVAESGVEARETFNQIKDDLTNKALNDKRLRLNDPEAQLSREEMAEIDKLSTAGSNTNFLSNLAIVGGTNFLMFGNMITGGTSQNFKLLRNNLVKGENGFALKSGGKARVNNTINFLKDSGSEAFQEGYQYASNIATNDYFSKKYNNESYNDLVTSLKKGIEGTFGSTEGLESMLIGAIVGGGMNRVKSVSDSFTGEKERVNQRSQEIADVLNTDSFKNLANKTSDISRGLDYIKDMHDAAVENDEAKYHKAAWGAFKSTVHQHLNQGTEEVLIEELESLKDLPQQEFNKFFGSTEGGSPVAGTVDKLIENTKKTIDIYKGMDYLYGDKGNDWISRIARSINKSDELVNEAYKDALFNTLTEFDYLNNREDQLGEEIQNITNNVITYNSNRENSGGYLSATKEQYEDFKEKTNRDAFLKAFKKEKELQKQMNAIIKSSKKFNSSKDFLDKMFKSKSGLSKKQAGVLSALEDIKQTSLNPAVQKEVVNKLTELHSLALQREIAQELYNRLENIQTDQNSSEFAESLKETFDKIDSGIKENMRKRASQVSTAQEKEDIEAEANLQDEDTKNAVSDAIEENVARQHNNTADIGIEEPLAEQLSQRYFNRELLAAEEIEELNSIVNDAQFDPQNIQDFLRKVNSLERSKSPDIDKIKLFYKE